MIDEASAQLYQAEKLASVGQLAAGGRTRSTTDRLHPQQFGYGREYVDKLKRLAAPDPGRKTARG